MMRRLVCTVILLAMAMLASSVPAQDAGAPDSVYIQFGHVPDLNTADRSLVVEFWAQTDTNALVGMSAGFGWDNPKLHLDSAVEVNHDWGFIILYDYNNIDSANAKQTFLYAGMALNEAQFLPPTGPPLKLANYYFTLNDWDSGDTVLFDTTSWDPGSELLFEPFEADGYIPGFAGSIQFSGDIPDKHVWYVSPGGSDDTGDGSRVNPFATIQYGVNETESGDTLVLMDGVYSGPGNYGVEILQKKIYITSENGPEATIINPEQQGFAFYLWDGLFGADGMMGPTINGITFTNGLGTGGGAIRSFAASPTIQGCVFLYNHADHGGAIYINGNDFFSAASPDSVPMAAVVGCTFVGNQAIGGSAIYYQYNSVSVFVDRCLFYGNVAQSGAPVDVDTNFVGGATAVLSCTDIFNNSPGDWIGTIMGQETLRGNLSEDPQFCEAFAVDYHISATSPCAPANNSCQVLIGAYGVGCGTEERYIWYVATDGNDASGDGSREKPFATIQHAADVAHDADTVMVLEGTYTGFGNRDIDLNGKPLTIRSEVGWYHTIINVADTVWSPYETHRAFVFDDSSRGQTYIEGFTIMGGEVHDTSWQYAEGGGAIYCDTSYTMLNIAMCTFKGNHAILGGGAIRAETVMLRLAYCRFEDNRAFEGGAIWMDGGILHMDGCEFVDNWAINGAALYANHLSFLQIDGSGFMQNDSDSGGTVVYLAHTGPQTTFFFTNCTFAHNHTGTDGGALHLDNAAVQVRRSIFAFNQGAAVTCNGLLDPYFACSDIYGNIGGDWDGCIADQAGQANNFSEDPLFCDPSQPNYRIQAYSPCAPDFSPCGELVGAYQPGCPVVGQPRSWWVSEQGEDLPDNGDQDYPFQTITYAINKAHDADTVQVMPGLYYEQVNFQGKSIIVRSTEGPRATTITNDTSTTLVIFENDESHLAVLEGFRLQGGWIGIHCKDAAPTIRHNVLVGQNVHSWASLVLSGKEGWTGHSPAKIINNTIVNCANGGISTFSLEAPTIKNNIIAFNAHYGIHREGIMPGVAQPLLSYNDVFGNPISYQEIDDPGVGTISADPMFDRGYGLTDGSPCIDAGDPHPTYNDPDGSRNDMGAIPFIGGGGPVVIPTNEWINIYCQNPYLDDQQMIRNEIRAYDPDGVLCGQGWIQRDGSFGFIPIYRDDIYTDFDEGAEPGDKISFTIDGEPVTSNPIVIWTENGDSFEVCHFTAARCMTLDLHSGWNLVSFNVAYDGLISDAVADFVDCIDVILSFEQGGLTYDPRLPEFSTLWKFNFHHGYWFKMNCAATIEFCGPDIPVDRFIEMEAGWNLVSYWPDTALPVEYALQSILTGIEVVAGWDNEVKTWMPGMQPYNSLSMMEPGFGYWAKQSMAAFLLYPGWGVWIDSIPFQNGGVGLLTESDAKTVPMGSRDWMSVYGTDLTLDRTPLKAGDVIEFFSADGVRCGQSVYGDHILKFSPVYGQDAADEFTKAYAAEGEAVTIKVNGNRVYPDLVWEGGGSRQALGELWTNKNGLLPSSYSLAQNYPNPFNPNTVILFDLPNPGQVRLAIYNVLGQQVRMLVDAPYSAGQFEITWDGCDETGQAVSSGIYLYRLDTGGFTATRKMVLMK